MGFLDRLRASQASSIEQWNNLTAIEQLKEIYEHSFDRPIVFFKHSTTCGISAGAKYRLESDWDENVGNFEFYYLDLLAHRDISNEIAERYQIRHESPQIIVVKDGQVVYHTSHQRINARDLFQVVQNLSAKDN